MGVNGDMARLVIESKRVGFALDEIVVSTESNEVGPS
jgi:hypothetical protein